jgi:UDP:flavonoid glycosyltransferase YjiC (YdhE family)
VRVLIVTWGWRSHLYPLVPLGWAVRASGDEAMVASHPSMVGPITAAGLPAVAVGPEVDFAEVFGGQVGPVRGGGRPDFAGAPGSRTIAAEVTADGGVARLADALLPDLVAFARAYRPDLIVYEQLNIAAVVAAAALGVPAVRHLWGPDSSTELALDEETVIAPRSARFGVSSVRLTGTLTLDPCPPQLQVTLTGPSRPVRFVPYNGAAVLPDWLWSPPTRPRICLTWGTMIAGLDLHEHFGVPAVLRALAGLDAEIVLALETAQHARLGDLPANVRLVRPPLALHLLLPSCQLLIHQGGAGTMMTGLAAGVPQLILPQVSDQHFNAWRLVQAGAGVAAPEDTTDPASLREFTTDLLGAEHWRKSARELRRTIEAMPSPADLVPHLRILAGRPGDPPQVGAV